MAKTLIDIEKLLIWAYRDELSKLQTSSAEGIWDDIANYGLHGIAPQTGDFGAAQRYAHFGLPHPDAVVVGQAVTALPDLVIDWTKQAAVILGDLLPLWLARDVLPVRSLRTSALIIMCARMDCRPDWREDNPRPHFVPQPKDASRPSIVGECKGRHRYTAGSYCPLQWVPSPVTIAMSRAEYVAWHYGLTTLARTLALRDHQAVVPGAPDAPWSLEDRAGCVIHEGVATGVAGKLPLKPVRPLAGPPLRRKRRLAKLQMEAA